MIEKNSEAEFSFVTIDWILTIQMCYYFGCKNLWKYYIIFYICSIKEVNE